MENRDQKIWVSQKALIFNNEGKFLTMRRTETAPTHPLSWDLPGGILGEEEDAWEAIAREIKEETGLEVKELKVTDVVSGLDKDIFWTTILYEGKVADDKVSLSFEHNSFKWVTADEYLALGISWRMRKFVENYKKRKQ